MVSEGRELVQALDRRGMAVGAALWVHDDDYDVWKLWIAPRTAVDPHTFYLGVAQAIAADRQRFGDLDVADTKLVESDHPAIRGARRFATITGSSSFRLKNDMLDGFCVKDGVVVSLNS